MFGSNSIRHISWIHSYDRIKDVFETTRLPRNWASNTRPLVDARKWHYRIVKEDDSYEAWLYHTCIAQWVSPDRVVLDVTHDSHTTRAFARLCFPSDSGLAFESSAYCGTVLRHRDRLWMRGKIDLQNRDDAWVIANEHELCKPWKVRLIRDKAALVRSKMSMLVTRARFLWYARDSSGKVPPWDMFSYAGWGRPSIDIERLTTDVEYVDMVLRQIGGTDVETVIKTAREVLYKSNECYEKVDYDA